MVSSHRQHLIDPKGLTTTLFVIYTFIFLFSYPNNAAHAHDLRGLSVDAKNDLTALVEKALADLPIADDDTRSVLANLYRWPVPRKLSVCFLSGTTTLRRKVTETMRRLWPIETLTQGNLVYGSTFDSTPDCGLSPTADIRVDFVPGAGFSSQYGIDSRNHIPSMNLQGFTDTGPTGTEFDFNVGHEMGHALGLAHEHQNPNSDSCNWDFNYLVASKQFANLDDAHYNIDKLHDYIVGNKHAYIFNTYDKHSIMHYYFEPAAFSDREKDPCYIDSRAAKPSALDDDAIQLTYGKGAATQQAATRGALPILINQLSSAEYSSLRLLLEQKLNLMDQ